MLEAKFADDPVMSFHSSIFKKNKCLETIVKLLNLPKKKKNDITVKKNNIAAITWPHELTCKTVNAAKSFWNNLKIQ